MTRAYNLQKGDHVIHGGITRVVERAILDKPNSVVVTWEGAEDDTIFNIGDEIYVLSRVEIDEREKHRTGDSWCARAHRHSDKVFNSVRRDLVKFLTISAPDEVREEGYRILKRLGEDLGSVRKNPDSESAGKGAILAIDELVAWYERNKI